MKKNKIITAMAGLTVLGFLIACSSPSDAAETVSDTVLDMASKEDEAEDAVNAFHEDGDAKEAEFDSILDSAQ